MLDATSLGDICKTFQNDARQEWMRLATLQRKIEGRLTSTWMPDNADLEYKDLFRKACSPLLEFGRDVIAQGCLIDGYSDEEVWNQAWQRNGMDGRQIEVNREVIGLGKSYGLSMPSDDGGVVMRPLSALTTFAVFEDPWDEFPQYVLHRVGKRKASYWDSEWMFVDAEAVYRFKGNPASPQELRATPHGLDFTPVVPIQNTLSLNGEPRSTIEPMITTYQRIVDATFTLQMLQRYGAFPQKWMAGGEIAVNEDGTPAVRSSVDGLLHAKGEGGESARFGTFESADLDQAVKALESHIQHFFSLLQIPPHYGISGSVINMSQEGITAAESGYHRNLADRHTAMGEGYELWLRTAAAVLGRSDAAADTSSEVHWQDVGTYSLNQVADAIVKLATVGAPEEMLFALVPGWTKSDVLEAGAEVRARRQLSLMQ